MIAAYAAVRFGTRDQLARVAAILSAAIWLYLCFIWREAPWAGSVTVPALAYALFGQRGRWRRPVAALLTIAPLEFAFLITSGICDMRIVQAMGGPLALFAHPASIHRWFIYTRVIDVIEFLSSLAAYLWLCRRLIRSPGTRPYTKGSAIAE